MTVNAASLMQSFLGAGRRPLSTPRRFPCSDGFCPPIVVDAPRPRSPTISSSGEPHWRGRFSLRVARLSTEYWICKASANSARCLFILQHSKESRHSNSSLIGKIEKAERSRRGAAPPSALGSSPSTSRARTMPTKGASIRSAGTAPAIFLARQGSLLSHDGPRAYSRGDASPERRLPAANWKRVGSEENYASA